MDAHLLFLLSVVCLFISGVFTDNTLGLATEDANRKCITTYKQCKLNINGLSLTGPPGSDGIPGIKGDMGYPGERGETGPVGERGPQGSKGEKGEKGDKGDTGDRGDIGPVGPKGESGEKGIKGEKGYNGTAGFKGEEGQKGDKGDMGVKGDAVIGSRGNPGPMGPPGTPGLPGVCSFIEATDDYSSAETGGTKDDPFASTCKLATVDSGFYYVHKDEPFKVYCDMSEKITCLMNKDKGVAETLYKYSEYKNSENATSLWLSQMISRPIEFESLYGVTRDHLSWLKERSTSAKQTLRIEYKDFKPDFGLPDDSISLLTSNDVIVKSRSTEKIPFSYSHSRIQNCDPGKWCDYYVDLFLHSESKDRLPIIDVLIKKKHGEDPQLKLGNIELCFG